MKQLSDGTTVMVQPMFAYPDGLTLGAELLGLALPVIGALPDGVVASVKATLSGGQGAPLAPQIAELIMSDGADETLSAVINGLALSIAHVAEPERMKRIARPLLACLTVENGGKMVELTTLEAIQRVTGTNVGRLIELLAMSLRANFANFSFGGGATTRAPASDPAG